MLDMRGGDFTDRIVADLPECLNEDDLLIVNNTRVLPARLVGKRGEAKINITLHHQPMMRSGVFAKPAKS